MADEEKASAPAEVGETNETEAKEAVHEAEQKNAESEQKADQSEESTAQNEVVDTAPTEAEGAVVNTGETSVEATAPAATEDGEGGVDETEQAKTAEADTEAAEKAPTPIVTDIKEEEKDPSDPSNKSEGEKAPSPDDVEKVDAGEEPKETVATNDSQEPAAADNTQEPAAADNTQEPAATDNTQEPAATDNTQEPAATDNTPEQAQDEHEEGVVGTDKPPTSAAAENQGMGPSETDADEKATSPPAEKPPTPPEAPDAPRMAGPPPPIQLDSPKPPTPSEVPQQPADLKPPTPPEPTVNAVSPPAAESPAVQPLEQTAAPQSELPTEGSADGAQVPTEEVPPPPPPDAPPAPHQPSQTQNILTVDADVPVDESPFSALNLIWSFGMNKNIPVLNLTDPNRKMIAYACAHAGILYNFRDNTQKILQGHCNPLSCMCTSADKRWLVTADKGRDNLVIIWDTSSGVPVQTLFDPHPEVGVAAIAMTPDAKYIATISAAEDQTLSIWDWTVDGEKPVCKTNLKAEYGHQHYIHFNPDDTFQLVSNSESQVIFYSWSSGQLEYFAPPLQDEDFNKQVGRYSQTIYQTNSSRALTATSVGNLVVWDNNKPLTKVVSTDPSPDKKALKLVKLQDRAINVLTTTDGYIVTGDVLGHVRFLDQTLKLIMWYQDFNLGPISSISFACDPQFHDRTEDTWEEEQFGQHQSLRLKDQREYPADATIKAQKLIIRDFVVGTSTAVYGHITTQGTIIDVIHRDHDASVHALAAHPFRPQIAMGSYSGLLKLWDYEKRIVIASRYFERGNMIRCCSFDPTGSFIAVGFMNGAVNVVNAFDLQDECSEPFRYARDVITHCAFSHDSQYLATADGECTVSVFKAQHTDGEEPWIYLGRHRAHYKLIKDLIFGVQLDSNLPRLMSLGADRVLVEYDLQNSGKDDLRVMESDRIEQSAQPLCLTWYPALKKEHFILTVNDQYKFKLYNSTTKMCRKTLLGPTYGSPIQKIAIIPTPDPDNSKRYLAYINDDKVGLHMLPLDGNPHNAMALVAHPTGVANLACSYDGKYVFTAGGPDCTVHMWQLNVLALEAQSKMGGEDLIPFYGLLDGGRDGELFAELENYFYYAQIRSQGVNTMDTRAVSVKIPLSEVPYVMMAMGFYPSQQEIQDMLNEVKYSEYVETGKYVEEIDLGEFIRLYINHRPAFGLSPERLAAAFETLGLPTEQGYAIDRGELLDLLQSKGEHMTEYELAECLTTLLGFNAEGGSSEMHEFDPSTAGDIIEENLPQDITVDMFADELLGFSMYVPPGLPEGLATHETQTETLET